MRGCGVLPQFPQFPQVSTRAEQMCIRSVYTKNMATTRVFRSGNSQAVRIPREFRFRSKEVEIVRRGREVVLREKQRNLAAAFELDGLALVASRNHFRATPQPPTNKSKTGENRSWRRYVDAN